VGESAQASHSIASEISGVNEASQAMGQVVEQVNVRAEELAHMGRDLQHVVEQFKISLNERDRV